MPRLCNNRLIFHISHNKDLCHSFPEKSSQYSRRIASIDRRTTNLDFELDSLQEWALLNGRGSNSTPKQTKVSYLLLVGLKKRSAAASGCGSAVPSHTKYCTVKKIKDTWARYYEQIRYGYVGRGKPPASPQGTTRLSYDSQSAWH